MFGRLRSNRRKAERERLRAEITQDVMAQVSALFATNKVNGQGVPNFAPLQAAVCDIDAAMLNIKFFGYELGRRLAAALPPRTDTVPRPVGLQSKASTQIDMESDWVGHWCGQLGTPVLYHRKLWENAFALQAIYESGHMREGARGLGFGCGQEPLPSYLAAQGVTVTVTDMEPADAEAAGWSRTAQHTANRELAFHPHLVSRERFDAQVDFRFANMNAIPAELTGYDFCWSICAFEHLGSIAAGLDFLESSLATLRPGGLSVHTTEFNIDPLGPTMDNWPSVLFQRQHFTEIAERLRAKGHFVAELNFDIGDGPMDHFIDVPPWAHDQPPELAHWHGPGRHLKVGLDGFIATCFGILIRKAG